MSEFEPYPGNPCEFCTGNSAVVKKYENDKPVFMTSAEWCQTMNACAATIDWEKVYERKIRNET